MSIGEIASLIAALAFLLLVLFLAIPLWKLGKVFDQLQGSIKQVANDTGDTVKEVTQNGAGCQRPVGAGRCGHYFSCAGRSRCVGGFYLGFFYLRRTAN